MFKEEKRKGNTHKAHAHSTNKLDDFMKDYKWTKKKKLANFSPISDTIFY